PDMHDGNFGSRQTKRKQHFGIPNGGTTQRRNDGTTETQTAKRNADGRGHCADGRGELRKPRRDPALGETFLLLQQSRGMRGFTTSKMNRSSVVSAAVPVSAAVCVSSVPGADPLECANLRPQLPEDSIVG